MSVMSISSKHFIELVQNIYSKIDECDLQQYIDEIRSLLELGVDPNTDFSKGIFSKAKNAINLMAFLLKNIYGYPRYEEKIESIMNIIQLLAKYGGNINSCPVHMGISLDKLSNSKYLCSILFIICGAKKPPSLKIIQTLHELGADLTHYRSYNILCGLFKLNLSELLCIEKKEEFYTFLPSIDAVDYVLSTMHDMKINPFDPCYNFGSILLHICKIKRDLGDNDYFYKMLHYIDLFVKMRMNVNFIDEYKLTTQLIELCNNANCIDYICIVQKLLSLGADINAQDKLGNTALISLCNRPLHAPLEISQCLLESGADPNIKNNEGRTPLMLLCKKVGLRKGEFFPDNCVNIGQHIVLLIKYGTNSDLVDNNGKSVFFYIEKNTRISKDYKQHLLKILNRYLRLPFLIFKEAIVRKVGKEVSKMQRLLQFVFIPPKSIIFNRHIASFIGKKIEE